MTNSDRSNDVQDRDERDLAFSKMSEDLRHWLSEVSPLIFKASACLEMEELYGTLMTISMLRDILKEETLKAYGKNYPLLKDVHYEPTESIYIDPHNIDLWSFANK